MRIHRLQLTAFGPFPGAELVDLDDLSTGGLFLLHGPTGAGKTSVLDAVCFALYGRVPGARGGSARLRSDHAAPTVAPEVACEFSVSGRRFEVTRSPAWERPKKRGTGTTTEQARVSVRERDGDGWRVLTTRTDEAAHLLDQLLGLGLDQFTKLVLLPQGEFAAFLRADAEVRRQMLERLFGTDRFAAVQQWMRQHQLRLRHEVDAATAGTERLLAQAHQVAAPLGPLGPYDAAAEAGASDHRPQTAAPDAGATDPSAPDARPPAADGQDDPVAIVRGLQRRARQACDDATARRLSTQAALKRAAEARERGERLAALRREYLDLTGRRAALAAAEPDQHDRLRRLDRAGRAVGLVPVAATLSAATARCDDAARRLRACLDQARTTSTLDLPATDAALADDAATSAAADQARHRLAVLAAAEQDVTALAELDREVARVTATVQRATEAARTARDQVVALEREAEQARARREAAAVIAAQEPDAAAALAAAAAVVAAVAERDRLTAELSQATRARDDARRVRDDAREAWLDLRERRLAGIAAELAAALVPGDPCPVCGGTDHPQPDPGGRADRARDGQIVDQAAERAAQHAVELADHRLEIAETTVSDTAQRLAATQEAAGGTDPETAGERRDAATQRLVAARSAAVELADADRDLVQAGTRGADWAARREIADQELRDGELRLASARQLAAELRTRIADTVGDLADPGDHRRRVQGWVAALDALSTARREATAADAVRDAALGEADRAASAAGFATVAEALAAVADADALAALKQATRQYDDELAAVSARLADPTLIAVADQPDPVLPALVAAEEHARADDEAAGRRVAVCETAVDALTDLSGRLGTHLRRTAPALQRHRTAEQLSRCLDGTGGDNTRRMSLSAYVLAARLEQVAQAASERLAAMSAGRYTLVHSDDVERGRVRSGLSLRVVDEWTGARRDTASLSGGEAFYTSLALALGLADVVTAEAGGTAVETLFVDEGFGSLDEDTLDEVMDVLDGLRSGGRAVGLVSHVAELRTRIPSRLEVVKTRSGSHLRAATA